jgi:hypothetical protein
VAELIGAHARDVIFTSCATESNNAAIAAALKANPDKRHIVTSSVEHSGVLNYCMALRTSPCSGDFTSPSGLLPFANDLAPKPGGVKPPLLQTAPKHGDVKPPLRDGYRVTYLPVDRDGLLCLRWFN